MQKALSVASRFGGQSGCPAFILGRANGCVVPASNRAAPFRNLFAGASNGNADESLSTGGRFPSIGDRQTMASSSCSVSASSGPAILESLSAQYGTEFEGTDVAGAMEALANADAVCFDVDSTVITEEGIDVLAASLGKGEEVAAWTLKAMEGDTKFEDALAARLDIMKPSRQSIQSCLLNHPLQFSPGIERLIELLNLAQIDVFFVSGGFRSMIEPVAKTLCVAKTNIVANTILFHEDTGEYAGFDREELTAADMGKPRAVQRIKDDHGYTTVVMVGDGATDAQAKPPADAFIGFGGVSVRDSVREKACWYVKDFDAMATIVDKFAKST